MLNRLAVSTKVKLGFGLLLSITVIASLTTYVSVGAASSDSVIAERNSQELVLAVKAQENLAERLSALRGYLLTGNDSHLAEYQEAKKALSASMSALHELIQSNAAKERWQHSDQLATEYTAAVDQVVELKKAGKSKQAEDAYFSPQLANLRAQLHDSLTVQEKYFQGRRSEASAKAQSSLELGQTLSLSLGITGLLLGGVIAYVLGNWFSRVIQQVHDFVVELSNHNLTVPDLITTSEDEVAATQRALNGMKNQFHEVIASIASTAGTLANASEELSSSATQIATSSETQKDQTTQVAIAMEEMSSTVQQVSQNSAKASTAADTSKKLAQDGGTIVEDTVKVIKSVADATRETALKVEELGKSGEQIGKIVNVIDDIADQTNLLALNAAIEAARAGEQGRGFAVVADEVRKLAERTSRATKEIAAMIKTIQEETSSAVGAMHSGTQRVDAGVEAATRAGEALKQIIESSENVQNMVTLIATAATEEAAATEQVTGAMGQIAIMLEQSSIGAKESAKACADLSNLALELQQVVNKFQLHDQFENRAHQGPHSTFAHIQEFWEPKENTTVN
jgi:methyl-accepting chemotaxis protein